MRARSSFPPAAAEEAATANSDKIAPFSGGMIMRSIPRKSAEGVTKKRRKALASGFRAETVAALYLRLKGYRILARRYAIAGGEIDLIARKFDSIVFVEVKTRPDFSLAMTAIDTAKCRRISHAGAHWLAANPWAARLNLRGDAICLIPWRWPRHAIAALTLDIG
jgi:putative endonuclease